MVNFYTKTSTYIFNIKTLISYLVKHCFAFICLIFNARLCKSYIFLFLLSFLPVLGAAQTMTFSSANPAIPSATLLIPSSKQPIYKGTITLSNLGGQSTNLYKVTFTPTGTFVVGDISNYQFWWNTVDDLAYSTSIILFQPQITQIPLPKHSLVNEQTDTDLLKTIRLVYSYPYFD